MAWALPAFRVPAIAFTPPLRCGDILRQFTIARVGANERRWSFVFIIFEAHPGFQPPLRRRGIASLRWINLM